jgi:hypothetical protein
MIDGGFATSIAAGLDAADARAAEMARYPIQVTSRKEVEARPRQNA